MNKKRVVWIKKIAKTIIPKKLWNLLILWFRKGLINTYYFKFIYIFLKPKIDNSSQEGLVVSITSFPKRINIVYLTIESILNQSIKPEKILLQLSLDEFPKGDRDLPKELLDQKKRWLTISFNHWNIKAHKKLTPTLAVNKNKVIVTVDDDILYPSWFLLRLFNKYKEYPKDIIWFRWHRISVKNNCILPYSEWMNDDSIESWNLLMLTWCSWILYPPNSLDDEIFNEKVFMDICPHNDDIWFKAMAIKKWVIHRKVSEKSIQFPTTINSQVEVLSKINIHWWANDIQFSKVFSKYKLFKYLI